LPYVFLQCTNEKCRFRFPASAEEAKAARCPQCHSAICQTGVTSLEKPDHLDPLPDERTLAGLLDNIRSIHNVGSMFRTADGAGVTQLYLAGMTATPDHPKLAKAALGANETIPWAYFPNGIDSALALRAEGFQLWALERLATATNPPTLSDPDFPSKIALVVGNEKAGIDPGILELCDAVLGLPMSGHKSSLNAAVAFGIALYWLRYGKIIQPTTNRPGEAQHGDDWQAGKHAGGENLDSRVG